MSAVVRMGLFAAVVGIGAGFFCWGMVTDRWLARRARTGRAPHDSPTPGHQSDHAAISRGHGAAAQGEGAVQAEGAGSSSLDVLFSAADRQELEVAFSQAEQEELDRLRERASQAAARLRSSAVPVDEVCSTGAGHRAQTLRVRFADGTTVVLCCRGSSGSYWVQALRRQILSGGVVLDRMTFGLAGPVVVFGTPAGEVFVMAELVTVGS
ncbi:MAG TPA: hypothetical protein VG476_03845 [Acidimicrobiales bacterium]|nr:hypothetical protein [Acidimicrobiales bacterium]